MPVFRHNLLLQVQAARVEDFQAFVLSSPLHVSRQLVVHLQDLAEDVVVDLDVVVAVVDLDAGHRVVDLDLGHRLGVVDEVKQLIDFVQVMLLHLCSITCEREEMVSFLIVTTFIQLCVLLHLNVFSADQSSILDLRNFYPAKFSSI